MMNMNIGTILRPAARTTLAALALGLVTMIPVMAQTSAGDIQSMLETRDDEIKSILGTTEDVSDDAKEELKELINGVIDFRAMGQQALGEHWDGLSEDQQIEFVDVFATIVRSQSLADLDVYRSTVTYDDVVVDGTSASAVTTTTYNDVPTEVVYDMHLTGSDWKVTDIVLDEVSTAGGYARSFQASTLR